MCCYFFQTGPFNAQVQFEEEIYLNLHFLEIFTNDIFLCKFDIIITKTRRE